MKNVRRGYEHVDMTRQRGRRSVRDTGQAIRHPLEFYATSDKASLARCARFRPERRGITGPAMSPLLAYLLLVLDLGWLWWLVHWYSQDG